MKRRELRERRVERLEAKQGDIQARLKLAAREKKALKKRQQLRDAERDLRAERLAPVKNAATKGKSAIEKIGGFVKQAGGDSTSPFSPKKAAPTGSDKTRAILGAGNNNAAGVFGGGGRNPFYDEKPKKEKPSGRTITVRIS